ncbi:hypothetical protein VFPPC_00638 [Pochonia chlamydosporia 170]|uniref:Uncharacterized protein n=1 Tax=Pochonia chlamydosporia 170 TaxID=1380566 RepID=A0A179G4I9_METCM|nr:hypothetical protein VFPPC_00638 [Pochonia chlamydosporia 170]OAQ72745.1 hypothetical protein VFPPC_00638 [Pochonia chlamydosporia 170]
MANGLDRLERLFAYKRKASPVPSGRASPVSQTGEQQFPSPSFIRPRASRMTAREEVRLRQATGRSPSVPDIMASHRAAHRQAYNSATNDCSHPPKQRMCRSPSFSQRNAEQLVTGLREFQFPKAPGGSDKTSSESLTFDASKPGEVLQMPSPRCRSPLEISIPPPNRLDTPPTSDNGSRLPSPTGKGPQIPLPPTPGQSPNLGPIADVKLRSVKSADVLGKSLFRDVEAQLGEPFDHFPLNRSYSQSSLAPSSRSFCSSTLREPDFNEFLNLSDDDIAESTPESPALDPLDNDNDHAAPPPLNLSAPSSCRPPASALLTLTPPRASRPAAAAAFEAARIARRYDFDLVYVVNLWPDTSAAPIPGHNLNGPQKPMIGRLLAAHGLHHVSSPLQICELIHTQVLRSDGWIEYRNQDAQPHGIARGFTCAFYTGQYARSTSSRSASPVSGVRLSERIDRGIVFAAYRKPREGEEKLGRTFSDEELGDLHREAEVLVEMVIDIHVANRSRQPPTRTSFTDETGPMPLQQVEVV